MLIFHTVCHGIPKLKHICRTHSLPLPSIEIFHIKTQVPGINYMWGRWFPGYLFLVRKQIFLFVLSSIKMHSDGICLGNSTLKERRKAYFLQPSRPWGITDDGTNFFTCTGEHIHPNKGCTSKQLLSSPKHICISVLDAPLKTASPSRGLSLL